MKLTKLTTAGREKRHSYTGRCAPGRIEKNRDSRNPTWEAAICATGTEAFCPADGLARPEEFFATAAWLAVNQSLLEPDPAKGGVGGHMLVQIVGATLFSVMAVSLAGIMQRIGKML